MLILQRDDNYEIQYKLSAMTMPCMNISPHKGRVPIIT